MEIKLCHGVQVLKKNKQTNKDGSGMSSNVLVRQQLRKVGHVKKKEEQTFDKTHPLVSYFKEGMQYELWQLVGNGGNKKLFVENASLFVQN